MSAGITVLVVDDHALVRDVLLRTFQDEGDITVVGTAGNAEAAIAAAEQLRPDIVLMDIDMPGKVCFEAAGAIQANHSESRVIFLSGFFNDRYISQALAVRAWGYLVKKESAAAIVAAVRRVHAGETVFSPAVQERLIMDGRVPRLRVQVPTRLSSLTNRETDLLLLVARGLGHREIAERLSISVNTVHRHVSSIMRKLDVHDRVELARFAIREGLAEA